MRLLFQTIIREKSQAQLFYLQEPLMGWHGKVSDDIQISSSTVGSKVAEKTPLLFMWDPWWFLLPPSCVNQHLFSQVNLIDPHLSDDAVVAKSVFRRLTRSLDVGQGDRKNCAVKWVSKMIWLPYFSPNHAGHAVYSTALEAVQLNNYRVVRE